MSEKIGAAPTGHHDDSAARRTHWRGAAAPDMTTTENKRGVSLYTHNAQPNNEIAYALGAACVEARIGVGDQIDLGLSLLRALQARGFGIAAISAAKDNK